MIKREILPFTFLKSNIIFFFFLLTFRSFLVYGYFSEASAITHIQLKKLLETRQRKVSWIPLKKKINIIFSSVFIFCVG